MFIKLLYESKIWGYKLTFAINYVNKKDGVTYDHKN